MSHDVFISYSSWDRPFANAVCGQLEENGVRCWMAPRDIPPDLAEFSPLIEKAIDECRIAVLVLSSKANSSSRVVSEVGRATGLEKLIVPLKVEHFMPTGGLEYALRYVHCLDAVNVPIHEALKTLVQYIRRAVDLPEPHAHQCATAIVPSQRSPGKSETFQRQRKPPSRNYDVFISYRRDTDAQTARLIRAELQRRRFRVFLDVDDLRPGHFDEALLDRIEEAPSFLVILSKGSLDRCASPDDWLRREIVWALTKRKTVIPVMMPGFSFPAKEEFPGELLPIRLHHGVKYSHDFFDAMMEKIIDYLSTPRES